MKLLTKPKPKQRPRAVSRGKFVTMYTPKPTKDYETLIGNLYKEQKGKHFGDKLLKVTVTFAFKPPKSVSNRLKEKLLLTPYEKQRGDLDNLLKALFDGLNKIAYNDDVQVCEINAKKIYDREDYIEIKLEEL